jgi:hypothetical protein
MNTKIISIKTTSCCQLRCKNCFVVPWMKRFPFWHWSIDSVEKFIRATVDSGYRFKILLLSGGEPLLWSNLLPALDMIRASGITDNIKMLTNSIAINEGNLDWFDKVVERVDIIRISRYVGNEKSVDLVKERYRANRSIHFSDKTEFVIQTKVPVAGSLPASCACDYPTVFGDTIYACGGSRFLSYFHKIEIDKRLYLPIKKNYLRYLESEPILKKKMNQIACQYCMVNRKVLASLGKEPNYCLKGKKDEACIA